MTTARLASGGSTPTTAAVLAGKTVRTYLRDPQLFLTALGQGVLFLLIFRYVFGGAIESGAVDYVQFLVPGIVTVGVLFTAAGAAVNVAREREAGFTDRLRSLPVPAAAALSGRVAGETAVVGGAILVTASVGVVTGFRFESGLLGGAIALGILLSFAAAAVWTFTALGLLSSSSEAASGLAFLVVPPTFVSSAFVPVETMPGWLQVIARNQPVTDVVNAVRALTLGETTVEALAHPAAYYATRALSWSAVLIVLAIAVAVRRLRG